MQKTRKSIAKRFKITGSGKILRRSPGHRHGLRKRSKKQKRRAAIDKAVAPGLARQVRVGMPHDL